MLQFILADIVMIALGVILFLIARALPRIGEEEFAPEKESVFERWLHSGIPQKVDAAFNTYFGKFLRRIKVVLLKLDNFLSERLKKMGAGNGTTSPFKQSPNKPKIDFKEIQGSEEGEKLEKSEEKSDT